MSTNNPDLRQYSSSAEFAISLTQEEVLAMVLLSFTRGFDALPKQASNSLIEPCTGLRAKGLVDKRDAFALTTAGLYVLGLLKEAGIYQETLDRATAEN